MGILHCPFRFVADALIIAYNPVIISRILKDGTHSLSATTLGFHLIVCLTRYPDIWSENWSRSPSHLVYFGFEEWFNRWYAPIVKAYLTLAALLTLVLLFYQRYKERKQDTDSKESFFTIRERFSTSLKEYLLYLIPVALLAYRFNDGYFASNKSFNTSGGIFSWLELVAEYFSPDDLFKMNVYDYTEMAWCFSIYLAALADIPQYKTYYAHLDGKVSMDWKLLFAIGIPAFSRLLYLGHYIVRYFYELSFDIWGFFGGAAQVFIFWMFFVQAVNKVNNTRTGSNQDDDADLEAYEEEQWGSSLVSERQGLLQQDHDEPKDDLDSVLPVYNRV